MKTFDALVREDWLEAFLQYSSFGEVSPKVMYWVGISTIAACLQRKVFIDEVQFHWTPNFYILIVAEPAKIKKSTSIDIGYNLLSLVGPQVKMGPTAATWQAFVEKTMEPAKQEVVMNGGELFEHTSVTVGISEFGTFFDPESRELVDTLTEMWDARKKYTKQTKTTGDNEIVRPWINMIAATTPEWFRRNFNTGLVQTGFGSRLIIVTGEMGDRDVPYLSRAIPHNYLDMQFALLERLRRFTEIHGEFRVSEDAMDWGAQWYIKERAAYRANKYSSIEQLFRGRRQVTMHKLAIVIAVARGSHMVQREHLIEADAKLTEIEMDREQTYSVIGETQSTGATKDIIDVVRKAGPEGVQKSHLYRKQFMQTMDHVQFDKAVDSAVAADEIVVMGNEQDKASRRLIARKFYK